MGTADGVDECVAMGSSKVEGTEAVDDVMIQAFGGQEME